MVDGAKAIPKNPETDSYDDWSKRMADSLFEVCATADGEANTPTTVVHVDLDALIDPAGSGVSELFVGPVISNETARMLGCDSAVEVAIESDGNPIGIGRRSRKIPGWLPARWSTGTTTASSPAAGARSSCRYTTSSTGPTEAAPISTPSCCCAGGITSSFMRRAGTYRAPAMAGSCSTSRTGPPTHRDLRRGPRRPTPKPSTRPDRRRQTD